VSGPERMTCTLEVGSRCSREAVALLLIRNAAGHWTVHPRCDQHPADSCRQILQHVATGGFMVVPLPPDAQVQR
jgi:hypothetical protein